LSSSESIEIIVLAAVRNPGGAIFTGPKHVIADTKARKAREPWEHAELAKRAGLPEAGFLTSEGRFVDRFEAAKIASRAGQAEAGDPSVGLHSEDFPGGQVPVVLTELFSRALAIAMELHDGQTRKGKATPYFSHLMGVAGLVLDAGGDEEQAIAALLHDAIEDQGDKISREEIRKSFGERVAEIVDLCSDRFEDVDDSDFDAEQTLDYWRQRKRRTIEKLRNEEKNAAYLLVSCADKLHNAREILHDLKLSGPELWSKFNNPNAEEQIEYYRDLAAAFAQKLPDVRLAAEIGEVVERIAVESNREAGRTG
jgi:hypothetical protein